MQRAVQAARAESGQFHGKLKYMKMLHLFEGNKPALDMSREAGRNGKESLYRMPSCAEWMSTCTMTWH